MEYTGAQILVRSLMEQGVDTLFAYPGGAVIQIFDALDEMSDAMRVIQPAHEQGGAHAADGYARITGKPGVVLATSGPGATNLVTGIANAYMDSVPLVVITGNVPRRLMGRDSFQEVDTCGITMPITKHNFLIQDAASIAQTVKDAFSIALSGRTGPVLVDIPMDVASEKCEYTPVGKHTVKQLPPPLLSKLKMAGMMLSKSEKPLLFCGGGVVSSGGAKTLRNFAQKSQIPVAASLMGLTVLPHDHPLMLGMIGMHGTPASNYAGGECDLLISVGARFSDRVAGDRTRFAPHAKLIHIDIDPSEFDKNVICDLHIQGDAEEVLSLLEEQTVPLDRKAWLADIDRFKAECPDPEPVAEKTPAVLLRAVAGAVGENAVVVTDVGQHQMWTARYYPFSTPKSLLTSGGLGAMGFGLGAALGAKAADPERTVVLITGDGSFHMNMNELSTAAACNLPIVIVLMNNGVLGMVRQWQRLFCEGRTLSTAHNRPTDYVALAKAMGCGGVCAESAEDAAAAVRKAVQSGKTTLIDCKISPDETVLPMIPPGKSGVDIIYDNIEGGLE